MKPQKVIIRPEHHSQYTIEGGEIFALEGILLGVAGGWWVCHQLYWHWLAGVLLGAGILAGFMWLLSMTITRFIIFGLNALGAGLLSYLIATALLGVSNLTGSFIGLLMVAAVATLFVRRFQVFKHDLTTYRSSKEDQTNQVGK
ncbi:hypothetical protein [uncultured Fibrella sp.]|uniref:hypothetical protein n=1 Tax=uncultured Fibrella sp. TaxID=1284596 RepID=UPI0035CBB465